MGSPGFAESLLGAQSLFPVALVLCALELITEGKGKESPRPSLRLKTVPFNDAGASV